MSQFSIKKFIPSAESIKSSKSLRFLGTLIHDPNLFHLNRRSVSVAVFWGLLIGFLPIPGHTPAAAVAALLVRCNLPLTMALVWVNNPITLPFILYIFYQLGRFVLQIEPISSLEFSWHWLASQFSLIWRPILTGSILGGLTLGGLGYFICNFMWRLNVKRKWLARCKRRAAAAEVMKEEEIKKKNENYS